VVGSGVFLGEGLSFFFSDLSDSAVLSDSDVSCVDAASADSCVLSELVESRSGDLAGVILGAVALERQEIESEAVFCIWASNATDVGLGVASDGDLDGDHVVGVGCWLFPTPHHKLELSGVNKSFLFWGNIFRKVPFLSLQKSKKGLDSQSCLCIRETSPIGVTR
jgi:hypothetical protein